MEIEDKERLLAATFYEVEKRLDPTSKYGYGVFVKDTDTRISEVSEKYVLVPNKDAITPFLERYGIEKLSSIQLLGGSVYYKFEFDDEIDMGGGDILRHQGYLANSYNKATLLRWQDAWFRKMCSNGMFGFSSGYTINEIHYGRLNVERIVDDVLGASMECNVDVWKELKKIPVNQERKLQLIEEFDCFNVNRIAYPKDGSPDFRKNPAETVNNDIKYFAGKNARRKGFDLENPENGWGLLNNLELGD